MNHFMNKSIENYNYLKGKISLVDAEVIDNPLLKLKNKVINKRIAEEIQPFVYRGRLHFYITNSLYHLYHFVVINILATALMNVLH